MSHGKYRQRTNSIPTLFALEEESIPGSETHNGIPPKPPRRSSLAINLLGNRGPNPEKHNKRRSSIAVAFLGRHNKVNAFFMTQFTGCVIAFCVTLIYIKCEPIR